MRVLVVHAHPGAESFSASLCTAVRETLEASGHDVDLIDLYRDGFDPVMSPAERAAYETDAPIVASDVHRYAARVKEASAIVFVYPTWWSGLPAILKGWLDRVLVPGVGFVFDRSGRIRPGLTNIRRIVAVTTYGASTLRVHLLGDAGRRTLARTLRMNVRRRARPWWLAMYGIDTSTPGERARFEQHVRRRLARL